MRLHIDDMNGPDIDKAKLVMRAEVFLDGVKIERAIMADEELGEVELYIEREDPRWKTEFADVKYWPTEFKRGKVEIKFKEEDNG